MITLLVDRFIKPIMSANSFRKDKLTWNRGKGEIIHLLDIQKSQWNDKNDISFTINLGVCVKSERQIFWNKPFPKTIRRLDCFLYLRVGRLFDNHDHWWTLKPSDDIDRVGKKLQEIIENKCIPFLDNLDSINKAIAFVENEVLNQYPAPSALIRYAILKYLNHLPDEAYKILNTLLADNKCKFGHSKVKEVFDRLNSLPVVTKN